MSAVLDAARSTLRRLGDEIPGCKAEIIRGRIVMSPVRPFHRRSIFALWAILEREFGAEWRCISDVRIPFADRATELCPDLAVIPGCEEARNLDSYPPELIRLAVEVVPPGSGIGDDVDKATFYAAADVPLYAIFDPYAAVCRFMWDPQGGAYLEKEEFVYGQQVSVPGPLGKLRIDTSELPVDPGE